MVIGRLRCDSVSIALLATNCNVDLPTESSTFDGLWLCIEHLEALPCNYLTGVQLVAFASETH